MGKTLGPQKKTKPASTGKQTRVDRIVNDEADEEIRQALHADEYLKHIEDISDTGKDNE